MVVIRRLNCFDYPKLKKLISYLCTDEDDKLARNLTEAPLGIINALVPLQLKFRSESFILTENSEILGLITVNTTTGNPFKINITRLIFKENRYEIGKMLIDFVVQKMGGKGAKSFTVVIDECHEELFDLFVNGCGFRQCSSETLWKKENPVPVKTDFKWRYAQNSDACAISSLYNDEILNIFKTSLERNPKEFTQRFFQGFNDSYKSRFVCESNSKITGYFSITTSDNINYILDLTLNSGYEFNYDEIINTMLCEIALKKRAFYPLVKQKKYFKNSEQLEEYLKNNSYTPIQTQHILVKDFYKLAKQESESWKVFMLGENQINQGI